MTSSLGTLARDVATTSSLSTLDGEFVPEEQDK